MIDDLFTGDHEDVMLHCGQMSVPSAQQSDEDKHQSLGVEWWPAEEERHHHRNCDTRNDQWHLRKWEMENLNHELNKSKTRKVEKISKNLQVNYVSNNDYHGRK